MKKIFIILLILIAFSTIVNAAMNPDLKECMQRDYEIKASPNHETICIFPDNSNCTINDFNLGICGEEFMTKDYCVKEGLPVWDKNKCCEGTEAYLPPNVMGQSTCRDISISQKISNQFLYQPILSISIILILIIVVFTIFWILKKRK
jgi:hypothetical protein|tara:strand:- start:39 stop:482 length:444 start_codon:yes stop_codon:yes gene_type:complete